MLRGPGCSRCRSINVDKVLDDVSELRAAAKDLVEGSVGDSDCNTYFDSVDEQGSWDEFHFMPGMDLNWFVVFGEVGLRVHGFASRAGDKTTVHYRVAMYDVYNFPPAGSEDLLSYSYADLNGLHTAGLARNFVSHGQSSERVMTL